MNVVMSSDGGFIEVQGTGEERPLTRKELDEMLRLAERGCNALFEAQRAALA
jgi:ribonuclease PH